MTLFVRAEIAEALQKTQQVISVVRVELGVECLFVHRLCQHLGNVALGVVGDATPDLSFAAKSLVALKQVRHRLHHIDFQRHAKFLAVVQHAPVMVREASGTQIQIQALVEVAYLLSVTTPALSSVSTVPRRAV